MKQLVLDRVAALQANPSWTGDFSGTTYFYGYMTAGHQSIGVSYYASYSLYTSFLYAPVITWNATTFDQWVWPDPTLHGVLPQMASSSQLLSTFGITAARWSQQVELPRSRFGSAARQPLQPAPVRSIRCAAPLAALALGLAGPARAWDSGAVLDVLRPGSHASGGPRRRPVPESLGGSRRVVVAARPRRARRIALRAGLESTDRARADERIRKPQCQMGDERDRKAREHGMDGGDGTRSAAVAQWVGGRLRRI